MLTETEVRAIKPLRYLRKVSDGGALYLLVTPKGRRWWRYAYRFAQKHKALALGTSPEVPLEGNWCIKGVKFRVYSRKSGPAGTLRFLAGEVLTRVLDPTFALVTRRVDIDRAQTRIVSCVSDGQVRCRPK